MEELKMENKVIIETSARHVHVSKEDLETLFGAGYELTKKKDLSQPGQFACAEKVEVVGPKKSLMCSILGPCRSATQIELSMTDARSIGINGAPVRESGDLEGSAPCKLVGPAGTVELTKGVIIAKRHIHATPAEAEALGLEDKQIVSLKVEGTGRATVFGDVIVRVSPSYAFYAHFDTDEANAAALSGTVYGEIIK